MRGLILAWCALAHTSRETVASWVSCCSTSVTSRSLRIHHVGHLRGQEDVGWLWIPSSAVMNLEWNCTVCHGLDSPINVYHLVVQLSCHLVAVHDAYRRVAPSSTIQIRLVVPRCLRGRYILCLMCGEVCQLEIGIVVGYLVMVEGSMLVLMVRDRTVRADLYGWGW